MSQKRITLRDIAERTNVSRMTVSLALRDDPHVSKATRDHIQNVAKELGYVPDAKLSQLMSKVATSYTSEVKLGELAFITSFDTENDWKSETRLIYKAYKGALRQASQMGYTVTPYWALSRKHRGEGLNQILLARGIEGIIIPPLGLDLIKSGKIEIKLDWSKYCIVQVGSTMVDMPVHTIRHNHFEGMCLCLENLEALGYGRIGLVLSNTSNLRSYQRWSAAYLQWRALRGHNRSTLPCFNFDNSINPTALSIWITQHKIDAIIGTSHHPLQALKQLEIKVPEELGLALLDVAYENDPISGIDQLPEAIGAAAVDNLVLAIKKGSKGIPEIAKQISIAGRWVKGETTKSVRKKRTAANRSILEADLFKEFDCKND
ncbi:LacI family DNA-binding transcriptional regulator [Coraliomargarita algicola]|uniref:LacI family DNA-binding transcriptional regulator n=1 Tax=Coraliomargarita algicola TaxID=3092156 RepID=A0ABZ0RNM8_9BACT|nr:LacI family DNA-binding transcriptional regulator [Coraliomargarita sp. J2-16]WPJ97021.1 LacI family DNA-binding transcriptional regulator [Coraliomargarita sp. J2-16]